MWRPFNQPTQERGSFNRFVSNVNACPKREPPTTRPSSHENREEKEAKQWFCADYDELTLVGMQTYP